jgi:hypothetical protein
MDPPTLSYPRAHDVGMEFSSTVEFANAARLLSRAAARRGLAGPSYRCPPRLVGVDRSIRRRPPMAANAQDEPGDVVVAIRVKDRPREAVLADMIEGVVVANDLKPPESDRVRNELWSEVATVMDHRRRGAA